MADLHNLFRSLIMDHYKNPVNKGLEGYPSCHLKNPSCGDDMTIEADVENNVLRHVRFDGTGCSICSASASVLCQLMEGKTVDEATHLIKEFLGMLTGEEAYEDLEDAAIFEGVSQFPARIKCAALPYHALARVLGSEDINPTEGEVESHD